VLLSSFIGMCLNECRMAKLSRVQAFALRWITGGMKGTPNGALEILSGIPPVFIRANLMIAGYVSRIATLPHNHLLKLTWDINAIPPNSRTRRPRRRPKHLPSDNPIQRMRHHQHVITEHFDVFHEANRPGNRIIDRFAQRIIRHHTTHPKKGTDSFRDWMADEFKPWLATIETSPNTTIISSDGGFWRPKRQGVAAFVVQRNGIFIDDDYELCTAGSSFDAEIQALLLGMQWLSENWSDDHHDIYFLIDNQGVLNSALDMEPHSSHAVSIRLNLMIDDILTNHANATFHFSYCPSHVGIAGNEKADRLVNQAIRPDRALPRSLRQHFDSHQRLIANQTWSLKASSPSYRGRQWLAIKRKGKTFTPRIGSKPRCRFFITLADDDIQIMTRITRVMTNHAPTGEHSARLFPGRPTNCTRCGDDVLHSRAHILTCCTYLFSIPNLTYFKNHKHNDALLKKFIKNNVTAFSFDDLPDDIP